MQVDHCFHEPIYIIKNLINTPSADSTEKPKHNFNKVVPSKDSRIDSFLSKYARN